MLLVATGLLGLVLGLREGQILLLLVAAIDILFDKWIKCDDIIQLSNVVYFDLLYFKIEGPLINKKIVFIVFFNGFMTWRFHRRTSISRFSLKVTYASKVKLVELA